MTTSPEPARPVDPAASMDLLRSVMSDTIDADYAAVAGRRPNKPVHPTWVLTAVALGIAGLLVGASAVFERDNKSELNAERAALVQHIRQNQDVIAQNQERIDALRTDIDGLQGSVDLTTSRGQDLLSSVTPSRSLVGAVAVTGPGVRIVVDDAPGAQPGGEGQVRDTDLQLLVNGLWQVGAEAISINGHRLGPLTAIRTAGTAITVNFRSLRPPYTVLAIGNEDTMQAQFVETTAGQTWLDLETVFGLGFEMTDRDDIEMTSVPRLAVTYADRQGELP